MEVELTIKSGELFRGVFPDLHVKDEVWRSKLESGCDNQVPDVLLDQHRPSVKQR